ncbi:hypothetical protein N7540_004452 [Penicillium herquei]|nr:hypothetical protein N7540_004452 [Penicillium herquei]
MSTNSTCPADPQPGQAGYMTANRIWNVVWTPANYLIFGPIGGEWLKKGYGKVKFSRWGWSLLPEPTPSKELARILTLLGSKESMDQLIKQQKEEKNGESKQLKKDVEQGLPAKEARIMKLVVEASPILTLLRSITTSLMTSLPLSPDNQSIGTGSNTPAGPSAKQERATTIPLASDSFELSVLQSITGPDSPLSGGKGEGPTPKKSNPRSVNYRLEKIETILQSPEVERTELIDIGDASCPSTSGGAETQRDSIAKKLQSMTGYLERLEKGAKQVEDLKKELQMKEEQIRSLAGKLRLPIDSTLGIMNSG